LYYVALGDLYSSVCVDARAYRGYRAIDAPFIRERSRMDMLLRCPSSAQNQKSGKARLLPQAPHGPLRRMLPLVHQLVLGNLLG
ncbi:MAG: hypothetical protein RR619_08165, partial [Raoultibacter sp.]